MKHQVVRSALLSLEERKEKKVEKVSRQRQRHTLDCPVVKLRDVQQYFASGVSNWCAKIRRKQSIQVVNGVVQKIEKAKAQCPMCFQQHFIKAGGLCEGCFEGNRNSLRYRCDGCNRQQTISHPMYRYQPSPTESGGATWACHQRCGDYTRWCIIPEDLDKIPMGEAPEAWGLHENFLE